MVGEWLVGGKVGLNTLYKSRPLPRWVGSVLASQQQAYSSLCVACNYTIWHLQGQLGGEPSSFQNLIIIISKTTLKFILETPFRFCTCSTRKFAIGCKHASYILTTSRICFFSVLQNQDVLCLADTDQIRTVSQRHCKAICSKAFGHFGCILWLKLIVPPLHKQTN